MGHRRCLRNAKPIKRLMPTSTYSPDRNARPPGTHMLPVRHRWHLLSDGGKDGGIRTAAVSTQVRKDGPGRWLAKIRQDGVRIHTRNSPALFGRISRVNYSSMRDKLLLVSKHLQPRVLEHRGGSPRDPRSLPSGPTCTGDGDR